MKKRDNVEKIITNMEQVIVGKREKIEMILVALMARGHILLEDVPGVGKTTMANALAKSISCGFSRITFTPDTLPSDVTGISVYNMQTGQFDFMKGAVMNHIILADEINRTSPKTQASLLEAMEERQVTVDGKTMALPDPFMVIATQNPIDYLGTYNLPEAQLDRFLIKMSIGYPTMEDEKALAKKFIEGFKNATIEAVVNDRDIVDMQEEVDQVLIKEQLLGYIVDLVTETRQNSNIALGASPRAMLALTQASRAKAYISGREYVIPDDILTMIIPVLAHRLVLTPEALLNKMDATKVLKSIISTLRIPY
ncbi:AAA family ATPase [Anaerosporobacter faecicola]|uniref:AAA family ATPase n=1 Tax=Anaerosporobacter faecicola TaxID=2718714 RepID=UPI001439B188|nr:MoxR family ATPase [Anaerosporobacter faecicola]